MNKEALEILLQKYMDGTLTGDERLRLERWYLHQARSGAPLGDAEMFASRLREIDVAVFGEMLGSNGQAEQKRQIGQWGRWVAMAAAVATIVFGVWLYRSEIASEATQPRNDGLIANDIAPGKYGATITLANGQVIRLDSAKVGVVVGEELEYDDGSEIASEAAQPRNDDRFNPSSRGNEGSLDANSRDVSSRRHDGMVNSRMLTATTARGQTYQFTLPDGTHVWLNADSKLEFPAQFSGKERRISMQGEAYFVVKHNSKQPFRVVSRARDGKEQIVEDIGTEFNIKAYPDEANVKTTLLEGSAAVNDQMLIPSQQASFNGNTLKVEKVDTEEVTSWKNGFFVFKSTTLESVLSQVERWYNVEVVYSSEALKKLTLSGSASRNSNVSVVLQAIENTGTAKFKIDGKKITVLK